MAYSAFDDKSHQPTDKDIIEILGRSAKLWFDLKEQIRSGYPSVSEEWSFPGAKWGWSMRLRSKKRVVLYMTPQQKCFTVGMVFGDKAVKAAHDTDLPRPLLKELDAAPKYGEGRPLRIEIRTRSDLAPVAMLAAIKMAN